jgi:zinc/manganese transport system permease protein
MINILNLCVNYKDSLALDNISVKINKGQLVAIVGANSAGKSTLLKTIMRQLKPNSGCIVAILALSSAILYRPLFFECVDSEFFKSVSKLSSVAHYAFLLLVVLNLVAGFHALGTLMSVGLMILSAAIARFWSEKLGVMLLIALLTSIVSSYLGFFLSFHVSFATSPAIVLVMGVIYIVSLLFGQHGGLLSKK